MHRPRVLLFSNWYSPGFKAGGSQLAVVNLVQAMKNQFEFYVITRDRDVGDKRPFECAFSREWTQIDGISVRYLEPREQRFGTIARILRDTPHDLVHLNSVVSIPFSGFPLAAQRLGLSSRTSLIVSPHGELAAQALRKKRMRKSVYLAAAKSADLFRNVLWHATSLTEEQDIRNVIGREVQVALAPLLPSEKMKMERIGNRAPKISGRLRAIFLSRIDRMKNLDFAIDLIAAAPNTTLDIYGPVGQEDYWRSCQARIAASGRPHAFRYAGAINPSDVIPTLSQYDLLVQPSQSENFGYTILEAMAAGCPVLIGNRTPWSGVEKAGVGAAFPLNKSENFHVYLSRVRDWSEEEHRLVREAARIYASAYIAHSPAKAATQDMYRTALASS